MALSDYKVTEGAITAGGVVSLPDRPSEAGMSAAELKAAFDNLSKNVVGANFNLLIDALCANTAAGEIGFADANLTAENVAQAIAELLVKINANATKVELNAHKVAVNPHNISAEMLNAVKEATFLAHTGNTSNPHNVTATQVGAVETDNIADSLQDADQTKIPTLKAVNDGISFAGGGDMLKSVYDTQNVAKDVFLHIDEKVAEIDVPTKVSQLTNDSNFATQSYVDTEIANIPTPDVSGQIEAHNTSASAHSGVLAPAYTYGTTDLTAGTSELETGKLYFVYE